MSQKRVVSIKALTSVVSLKTSSSSTLKIGRLLRSLPSIPHETLASLKSCLNLAMMMNSSSSLKGRGLGYPRDEVKTRFWLVTGSVTDESCHLV